MFSEYTKEYFNKEIHHIISNEYLISFFYLLEYLPILYGLLLSSIELRQGTKPAFITNAVKYVSYNIYFHEYYEDNRSYIFLIVILLIILVFFFYKFFLQRKLNNKILNFCIVNFYEGFFFQFLSIFIFDILANNFVANSSIELSLISLLSFAFLFWFMLRHFENTFIYLNLTSCKSSFLFSNKVLQIIKKSNLVLKIIISFEMNVSDEKIKKFLNLIILVANCISHCMQIYCILFDNLVYVPRSKFPRFAWIIGSIGFWNQIFFLALPFKNFSTFCGCILTSVFISLFLSKKLYSICMDKVFDEKNFLGMLLYILNEYSTDRSSLVVERIINHHKGICEEENCEFCEKISTTGEAISYEELCYFIFNYGINSKKINLKKNPIVYLKYCYLIDLYVSFLNGKNLIKLMNKYYNLTLLKKDPNYHINIRRKLGAVKKITTRFNIQFFINVDLLCQELIENSLAEENANLTKIKGFILIYNNNDLINDIEEIYKNFFQRQLYSPVEVMKLAHELHKIKNKIDFTSLNSKESRANYWYLLTGLSLEEIYNGEICKGFSFRQLYSTTEESLLDYHFKEEKNMLILYKPMNKNLVIKQSGKDLIDFKGKNLEMIFPLFLREEGKNRFINALFQRELFSFYYNNQLSNTVEYIKIDLSSHPFLNLQEKSIYYLCNYSFENKKFFIFNNFDFRGTKVRALTAVSKFVMNKFNITNELIKKSIETSRYITLLKIFEGTSHRIRMHEIEKIVEKPIIAKHKKLFCQLFEKIGSIDIYYIKSSNETKKDLMRLGKEEMSGFSSQSYAAKEPSQFYQFSATNTGTSSAASSSISAFSRKVKTVKDKHHKKSKKLYNYTYYIIAFNVLIILVVIIFLIIELMNNSSLNKTFKIIANYNTFQSYFYHTALSLFSLTCLAPSIESKACTNNFVKYSMDFVKQYGLSEDQQLYIYLAREIEFKATVIIELLTEWEQTRYFLSSKDLDDTLSETFTFDFLEENGNDISIVKLPLSFDESVKRFVSIVTMIISSDNYLNSPLYVITTDGKNNTDLTNIMLNKTPDKVYGFLNTVQKYFYSIFLNYQKYILKLLSIGNILYYYFEDSINYSSNTILIFFIILIAAHSYAIIAAMIFLKKFKNLHIEFFSLIWKKLNDPNFIKYFREKFSSLLTLREMFRKNPNVLIANLQKMKTKEVHRLSIIIKVSNDMKKLSHLSDQDKLTIYSLEHSQVDPKKLNTIYYTKIIKQFFLFIVILFSSYFIFCTIFFILIDCGINNLSKINKYMKLNYDITNDLYLNLGLSQIMSFTNQTDKSLYDFFQKNSSSSIISTSGSRNGYVRDNIQNTFTLIMNVDEMEQNSKYFMKLEQIVDVDCETLYTTMDDPLITLMLDNYPSSQYNQLFWIYCFNAKAISDNKNDKLAMLVVNYRISKFLDLFVKTDFDTYVDINENYLLFQIYGYLLIVVRPLRQLIYQNILNHVISSVINDYSLVVILFIFFSFIFEIVILCVLKIIIIDGIVSYVKEIIDLSKIFECFT